MDQEVCLHVFSPRSKSGSDDIDDISQIWNIYSRNAMEIKKSVRACTYGPDGERHI